MANLLERLAAIAKDKKKQEIIRGVIQTYGRPKTSADIALEAANSLGSSARNYRAPNTIVNNTLTRGVNNVIVRPTVDVAKKSFNTGRAATAGVVGLADIAKESAFGTDDSYQKAINRTTNAINAPLSRGAFITPQQSRSSGTGFQGLKNDFIKPTVTGVSEVAPFIAPYARGGSLLAKIGSNAGINAGVSGTTNVAQQLVNNGRIDRSDLAKSVLLGGAVGGFTPLATTGIKSATSKVTPIAKAAVQNRVPLLEPEIGSINNKPKINPETADIEIQQILQTRPANLRAIEQGNMNDAQRLQAAMGDRGQAGLQMLPSDRDALLSKFRGEVKAESLPENLNKRVGNIDKAARSTRSIIERQGEHGQELAGKLQNARDTQEIYLADLQKQLPTVTKIARKERNRLRPGGEFENFVEATQGKVEPKNARVAQAVSEWQATHPGIRDRAINAGLDVGDLGPNYYPHFIDYERVFKDKNTYNQAINHLVETSQAQSSEEAIKLLGYARDVSRNRQFGNLEASRLVDLPFYDKTPNSLTNYLSGSAKRIAQTETFGKGDEEALKLIAKAGKQGYDTEAIKNAFDVAVGAKQYNPTSSKVSGNIRKYITTTRLGLGALTNVSQNVNTGIVTGHFRTLASAIKQLDPKTRDFVYQTGVIADAVLNDIKTQQGYSTFSQKVTGKAINKVTAPGFGLVEKTNRSIAATAGRDYALRLAQKGDEKTLRKLGVKGEIKNKTLTEAQQIQAARKVVEITQFKVDPQDLPGWVDSPGGKLVAQFRTFSYNQGKFVSNEILKPAAKGNILPLSRLLAALPVGYGLYEARRILDGRPEEENKTKVGLQAFSKVGGAGLAFDLYQSINPPGSKYLPSDRRVSMATGAVGGPAVGTAIQGIGAVSEAAQRKNTPEDTSRLDGKVLAAKTDESYTDLTPAARFGLQQVPIVGTPIKNRLLPFKKESDADTGKTKELGSSTLADTLEQKSLADKNRNKNLKASLSKEDYALSQLAKEDKQSLVDQGIVTQDKIDGLDNYVKNKKMELGFDTKEKQKVKNYANLKPQVQKFLDSKAEVSSDDKDAWLQSKTDGNGKYLIKNINTIRPKDLPELPDNNKVASLYADFTQQRNEQKWSKGRETIEKRKLLQNAYKASLSEDDAFWLSQSDGAFRQAVDNGDIDKDRLDKLIAYDNLQATLGGTAQIGKTVRKLLGYGVAPGARYSGGKYASTGGAKKAKKGKRGRKVAPSSFVLPTDRLVKQSIKGANLAANAKIGAKL